MRALEEEEEEDEEDEGEYSLSFPCIPLLWGSHTESGNTGLCLELSV